MKNEEIGVAPHGRLLGVHGSPESLIFIGFIRFVDMADNHVIYSEKPNAF